MLIRQTKLAEDYPVFLQAMGNSATVGSIGAGELLHGLASEVLIGDLDGFGRSEAALGLPGRPSP